jgi:predicted nucleotidyltransferase
MLVRQMLFMDAPAHTRLRDHVQAIMDDLVDRVAPAGRLDVIADLAAPFPAIVTAEMLGVAAGDHAHVKAWSSAFGEIPGIARLEFEDGSTRPRGSGDKSGVCETPARGRVAMSRRGGGRLLGGEDDRGGRNRELFQDGSCLGGRPRALNNARPLDPSPGERGPSGGDPRCYHRPVHPRLEVPLQRFREALEARLGSALVTLAVFGSQVTGRARPESDLDVLLVAEDLPPSRLQRQGLALDIAHAVSDEFAARVSIIALTPEEARTIKPFYLGFLEGHRLLVDRDRFFAGVLRRLRARLAELGARRLTDERGNPYWDLKPDYVLGEDVVL